MVGGITRPQGVGNDVRPGPGVGEYDRLAVEALRGDAGVLLGAEALDRRDLLLALDEEEVPLEGNRPVVVPDERCPQFLCEHIGDPDGGREVQELGLRGKVLHPRDQAVQAVSPVRVLEHLHLVDDHRPDRREPLPRTDEVVDPLVRPDDDGGTDVPVSNWGILGQPDPGLANQDTHPRELSVPLLETLVLLHRERHQGDEEEGVAPPFEMVFHPCHLADECLSARGRRDDQEMFPMK